MYFYIFACAVMGLGIGLDVVLATLSRVRYLTPAKGWLWVRRITITHIAFPMVGYYGFIELFHLVPSIRVVLGLIAFSLIAIFLFDVVKGWLSVESKDNEGVPFSWAVVLSVSWDALFSGPAKSAQAIGWNRNEVFLSFFISGMVVTILALVAIRLALLVRRFSAKLLKDSLTKLVLFELVLMLAEFVIFLYFGLLALLRYSFSSNVSLLYIALGASSTGTVLFLLLWRPLFSKVRERVTSELVNSPAAARVNNTGG